MIQNSIPRCWHTAAVSFLTKLDNPNYLLLDKIEQVVPSIRTNSLPYSVKKPLESFDWSTRNLLLVTFTNLQETNKVLGLDSIQIARVKEINAAFVNVILYNNPFALPSIQHQREFLFIPLPKNIGPDDIKIQLQEIKVPDITSFNEESSEVHESLGNGHICGFVDQDPQFADFRRIIAEAPDVERTVIPRPPDAPEIFPPSERELNLIKAIVKFEQYVRGRRLL